VFYDRIGWRTFNRFRTCADNLKVLEPGDGPLVNQFAKISGEKRASGDVGTANDNDGWYFFFNRLRNMRDSLD
jgi:hypothetical protein